ncbi:MAG: hypothetical protein V1914_00095 [archaeon]
MELKTDEKKLLLILLKDHLKEVAANTKLLNQQAAVFAAEAKYEDFVEDLIKKLS